MRWVVYSAGRALQDAHNYGGWFQITLAACPRGYHLGRVQMEHGTFMGHDSTAQALFVHRR